ncbi:MAG: dihydroneopterin aldolase [Saprospiraceae bacterium]|jgi:dihydroneopterin aldolase
MAWIALEGMRFHAFHGVYEAESVLGTEYLVDVYVRTKTADAAGADDLSKTINYESIYHICAIEMEKPRKLIETVLASIVTKMKHQFEGMEALRVRLRKLNPPLGGRVDTAWVMEELDFMKQCPRCNQRYIMYDEGTCWDKYPNLHPASRETLMRQYGGKCLCDACLKTYVG